MTKPIRSLTLFAVAACVVAGVVRTHAQTVETAPVTAQKVERAVTLPAELAPFLSAALSARVSGFVDRVDVDRGTVVKQGQVLAVLAVPELAAQVAEAQSRVLLAETKKAEADSRLTTVTSALERLKRASATPGTVAGFDLLRAEEDVTAAKAAVQAQVEAVAGAKASVDAIRALEQYQTVTAPFAGRITERLVHPGALVGPATGPLFRLEQTSRLRLVIPVPEHSLGTIAMGRDGRVPRAVASRTDIHRQAGAQRRLARRAIADDDGRSRCRERRRATCARYVSRRVLAGRARCRRVARPGHRRRHDHRAHIRDSRRATAKPDG